MTSSPVYDEESNKLAKDKIETEKDDSDAGSDIFMPFEPKTNSDKEKDIPIQEVNDGESDTGSDIFMPDGVTKRTSCEALSENGVSEQIQDVNKLEDQTNVDHLNEQKNTIDSNDKLPISEEKRTIPDTVELRVVVRKRSISASFATDNDDGEDDDDDDDDDDDSLSGALEINTEVTPDIGDEKPANEEELVEDRNIFSNSDLFLQKTENDEIENSKRNNESGSSEKKDEEDDGLGDTPPYFENIETNLYLIDKKKSRCSKQIRRMTCECPYDPDDPLFVGCDEDCLNRLLMIECSKSCPAADFCTNRSFQKGCQYDLQVLSAGRKGWGLRTKEPIPKGSFVIEYCGEVVDYDEFHKRTLQYDAEGMTHYYFMTLKTNEIIDATKKGSKSRFINHSCDPNCVTQKWTVNGFLRVGFFALRHIEAYEELCFDYQFQRFGEKPQECYCGAENCRKVIGIESTNSIPSYIEKISKLSSSPSSSKQKKKKKQMKEFYESELAEELNDLLGSKWELKEGKQTLELLRLMVKVETLHERKELLKILQLSPEAPLKAFVHYKGLALLWSWMIDAPDDKPKYKVEILKTLKHIPIPNKNELDDSKLMGVILKWASSITDHQSSQEDSASTPSKRDEDGSDDESHSDNENKNDDGGNTSQEESSKEDGENTKKLQTLSSVEEGSTDEASGGKKSKKKDKITRKKERKESRKRDVPTLSAALLEDWKELKEVFRIPKKSQTPDRRQKRESDTSSPLPDDKKKSTVDSPSRHTTSEASPSNTTTTKTMAADSTFSSPPNKQKKNRIHKGIGAFLMQTLEEPNNDAGNKSQPDSNTNNGKRNNNSTDNSNNNKRNGNREWRKSPNINDDRGKRYGNSRNSDSTNQGADSSSMWDANDDSWDRRDSRRNRTNRNRNYDNDNEWNRSWNSNNSWRGRGAPRPWSNRGKMNNRDIGNNSDGNIDNSVLSWRKNSQGWSNQSQPQQQQQQQQQQPPNYGSGVNMNLPVGHNVSNLMGSGTLSNTRGPVYPGNMLPPGPPMFQPPPMPPMNPMLPNQMQQNSPLVSPMNTAQSSYNQLSIPSAPMAPSTQPDVTTLNVVNQLQLLLNAERLKQAQDGSLQGTPDQNRSSTTASPQMRTSSASPTRSKPVQSLPPHWKTATDSEGRMYYYHALTRETSWDPPMHIVEDDEDVPPPSKKNRKSYSSDSSRSPPSLRSPSSSRYSPRIVAADTTHHHGPRTPPGPKSSSSKQISSTEKHRIKESFKSKMSSVVVNCLNAYQKVDCKQGRIKNIDDFKFLARKLTHGLILKEIQRIKDESLLTCNDSVRLKVKEYVRNYMKKFGPYYIRS